MKLDFTYLNSAPKKLTVEPSPSKIPSGILRLRSEEEMPATECGSPFYNVGGHKIKKLIPILEELKKILSYDPETGIFIWKESGGARRRAGEQAGAIQTDGYHIIGIGKERYLAAHLAWYITYSEWPTKVIDHINGVKTDDRITNLRLVDKQGNAQNSKAKQQEDYGIYKYGADRFRVQLWINKRQTSFGIFSDIESARTYVKHLREMYGI